MIHWWEDYTAYFGGTIDNNPAPGNKLGGLTTIYEKSLGAVAKAGSTPLNQVVGYAERVTERGFVHMDTPGYDPVSVTGQVAGGCNVVVFTTGRGSAFGFKPAPSIKIATNSDPLRQPGTGHGHQRRPGPRRPHARAARRGDLRGDPRRRLRQADQERSWPASARKSSTPGFWGRSCRRAQARRRRYRRGRPLRLPSFAPTRVATMETATDTNGRSRTCSPGSAPASTRSASTSSGSRTATRRPRSWPIVATEIEASPLVLSGELRDAAPDLIAALDRAGVVWVGAVDARRRPRPAARSQSRHPRRRRNRIGDARRADRWPTAPSAS